MRKIEYNNPDLTLNEVTKLSSIASVGDTSISVYDTTDFSVNDFILVGCEAEDQTEVAQITAIPDNTTLTITILSFGHIQDSKITKVLYDKIKLYKSSDDITYTNVLTQNIDYQDRNKITILIDASGTDTDYYRVTFFNSFSSNETNQSQTIIPTSKIGYITCEEFGLQTGIKVHPDLICTAIKNGAEIIKRKLYKPKTYVAKSQDTKHFLATEFPLRLGDTDLDNRDINIDDFNAFEYDKDDVRYDLNSLKVSIDNFRNILVFSSVVPTASGRDLFVEYTLAPYDITELRENLKELNKLLAVNYVFSNVPFKKLQKGIDSWSMNGVSINFNQSVMNDVITNNEERIKSIIRDLQPAFIRTTTTRNFSEPTARDFVSKLRFR